MLLTIAVLLVTHVSAGLIASGAVTQELDEASREIRRLRDEKEAAEEELFDADDERETLREQVLEYKDLLLQSRETSSTLLNWSISMFFVAVASLVIAVATFNARKLSD
jgi:hypothetical protein